MIVGVPRELTPGERRVALVPDLVPALKKAGLEVVVETDAGLAAGFPSAAYTERGARVEADAWGLADVLLKVQPPTSAEVERIKPEATVIGMLKPYASAELFQTLAAHKIRAFAMELMPRITRAQPMDALSAMSTVAGYKAVLMAADRLIRFFPLLMTAAGTITPARVLVIGAGVAGLQAIGTARRLGALVEAYDTRPAVREQVESLGARFVDLGLDTKDAEDKTGYAKQQSEAFYKSQQEKLATVIAAADVVITTALVPGQRAPILITADAVQRMKPGSVIIDLAAEQGGNCELTQPGEEVVRQGVTLVGLLNLPSMIPYHASQLYARTVTNFLLHMVREGKLRLDLEDEIVKKTLVTKS